MVGRGADRFTRTEAAGEGGQVVGALLPGDVLTFRDPAAPALGRQAGDDRHDLLHRDVDSLLGQRRDRPVGDAAGDDVVTQVPEVGRDVEGEAVHRSPTREPHADRADLARVRALGVDPDPRVVVEPAGVRQTELGEGVDDQLLDRAHVGDGVGESARALAVLGRQAQDRIPDQLPRAVVGDVAASVDCHQLGADGGRFDEHVGVQVGAWTVGEDVRVLQQQQVLLVPVGEQRLLDAQRLPVGHPPQPAHPQHVHDTPFTTPRASPATPGGT